MNERAIAADGAFLRERIDHGHTNDSPVEGTDDVLNSVHDTESIAPYTALDRWPTDEPLPTWVTTLSTVCDQLQTLSPPASPGERPFGEIVGRFVSWATAETPSERTRLVEPAAVDDLRDVLWRRLTDVLAQPLHVDYCQFVDDETDATARSPDATRLRKAYAAAFAGGRFEPFFEEFSLAGRLLIDTVDRWRGGVERLLARLHEDREAVCRLTDGDDPFPVVGFSPEAGDRHADGEAVTVIDFGDERAVYKPRCVAPSRSLSRVFDRLAEVSSLSVPSPPTVVTRDGYGWAAHVDCDSFDARPQLSTYYDRAGVVAWLATLLGATDLHYENLVATGAGPVIVDAETAVGVFDPTDTRSADDEVRSRTLGGSVFGTGLVPPGESATRPDLSGLCATQPEQMNRLELRWTDPGTDGVDIRYERAVSDPEHNHPRLRGDPAPPWLFVDELTAGFKRAQETVREHAATLRDAVTTAFADTRLRAVLRQSQSYGVLLDTLSNPQYLRDAVAHERKATETLWDGWSNSRLADRTDTRPTVVATERDRLLARTVPRFTVPSDGRSLSLDGEVVVETALEQTPIASFRRRIERLCDRRLRRQRQLLSLAVSSTVLPPPHDGSPEVQR